jgi:RNA polymerase sigma-70 factor (ECF subfamily)
MEPRDDLTTRFRAGNREAMREVVERLLPRLRRTVRLLVPPEEREDAVQLCIVDILRGAASFRGESSIETWAQRIAVRRAVKHAKKRFRLRLRSDDATDPATLFAPAPTVALRDELPRPVTCYLDALPSRQRQAVVLRHAWGYSLAEIAELVHASPNTVKARLFHGLRHIRKMIRDDLEGTDGST